jgi:PleD family two-component response regulator
MRYRARVIGATLDLKSRPGQGTQVTCVFIPASQKSGKETKSAQKPATNAADPKTNDPKPMNNKSPEKKKVFIVDDHAMFREGLRQLIDREADLAVCGDAADATEALESIEPVRTRPGDRGYFPVRQKRH